MSKTSNSSTPWQQNLRAIWFAELVAIVGFAVVIPILPLYVKELGVESERQVRLWSGAIFSAHAVTMAIFAPIWGALSDRFGRKLMVVRAMFAGSVIMALMAFAQTPQQLALLRALQGCLTGTVTAARALVAASVPSERAGYALGTLQTAVYVGASAGPLLGGLVADTLGYRATFFITGFLLLVAALGVLNFVKEPSRSEPDPDGTASSDGGDLSFQRRALRHLAPVLASAPLLSVLSVHLIMRLAPRLLSAIMPLFVETVAPSTARVATLTGIITGANAIGGAIGGRQFGELGDRVGHRSILAICALLSTLFYVPQSMVGRSIWLIPLQAGAGLAMGGIMASISASLAALSPRGREGLVYGVDATVVSIANAIGPMTGSSMAVWLGLRAPFLAAAVIFVLAGIAALQFLPKPATAPS